MAVSDDGHLFLLGMDSNTRSWTVLARLLRPQGRKGELLAELFTDFPESLEGRQNLFLTKQDFQGPKSDARSAKVLSAWLPVGKNRGRVVLQLEGINSIDDAEKLSGLDLAILDDERHSLDEGENYVSELTGCSVYDSETLVGEVSGVQFPASSAGDRLDDVPSLLEVKSVDGDELLIPFVKAFLVSLDIEERKIVFNLPAGLLEVNR